MGNALIAFANKANTATFAGGSFSGSLPASNMGTTVVAKVARTSTSKRSDTRFRCTFATAATVRALALAYHTISKTGRVRMRAGRAALDLLFDDEQSDINDTRLTKSGGTNGTRVNSRGLIVPVTNINLALRSQQLDITWTKTNLTVSADATTAPNGTVTADGLVPTATNGEHSASQAVTTVAGSAYTYSHYGAPNGYDWVILDASGIGSVWFNVRTGAFGSTSGTVTSYYARQDSRGFWRPQITILATGASTTFKLHVVNADGVSSYAGDTVSGVYAWGAQIQLGGDATDYIATTAVTVTATSSGRINYGARRENLLTQSASPHPSYWTYVAASAVNATSTSVDGTATAVLASLNAQGTGDGILRTISGLTPGATYVWSMYVKLGSATALAMTANNSIAWGTVTQALSYAGTLNTSTYTRCLLTFTAPSNGTVTLYIGAHAVAGIVAQTAGTVYMACLQLEKASTAGYYLPTTTAARVDLAPWRTNVLYPSNSFSAWTLGAGGTGTNPVVWPNETAPDGTIATRVAFNAGSGTSSSDQSLLSTTMGAGSATSGSVYAHSLDIYGTAGQTLMFRGSAASGYTLITLTGAWQRVTTVEAAGTTSLGLDIGVRQGLLGALTAAPVVYIRNVQIERYIEATQYIATTTQARTVADECLGLLVEEARTNVVTYSEQFDQWTATSITVTANSTLAPNGTQTADTIAATGASGNALSAAWSAPASTTYTVACWAKRNNVDYVILEISDTVANNGKAWFNIATGAGGTTGGSGLTIGARVVEDWGNGWYRCSTQVTTHGSTTNYKMAVSCASSDGGNAANGNAVYAFGAGCQAGSFPTSYILTTSAAVTRAADAVSITGSNFTSFYNPASGSFFVEGESPVAGGNQVLLSFNDGSTNEIAAVYTDVSGGVSVATVDGGVGQSSSVFAGTASAHRFIKGALAFAPNDVAACVNGGTVQTDTSCTQPAVNQLNVGAYGGSILQLGGHIKRVTYFPERLKNSELVTLTTSGPDALGFNSGWMNALLKTYQATDGAPSDWGHDIDVLQACAAITAKYCIVEIDDTTNSAGYIDIGRFFAGTGLQPANSTEATEGGKRGRKDWSTVATTNRGRKIGTDRDRQRVRDFVLKWLTQAEADLWDEIQRTEGQLGEIVYVHDTDDMAKSQNLGGLGQLRDLEMLEYAGETHEVFATPVRFEKKQ